MVRVPRKRRYPINTVRRVGIVLAVFLIAAGAWNLPMAADPDADDITVVGWGGPPGCVVPAGKFLISNDSNEYYYRVAITNAIMENDSDGPARCENDPPDCSGEECECDLSGTFEVLPLADGASFGGCELPDCGVGCDPVCENTNCNSIDHCACVYGNYQVTHYSTDGEDWTAMPPAYPTAITLKEKDESCPELGPSCS